MARTLKQHSIEMNRFSNWLNRIFLPAERQEKANGAEQGVFETVCAMFHLRELRPRILWRHSAAWILEIYRSMANLRRGQ